jgi:carboxypeptidase T
MPRHRYTVYGKDYDAMADLVRKYHVKLWSHDAKGVPGGGFRVDIDAEEEEVTKLVAAAYRAERREDPEVGGRERQAELRAALQRTGPADALHPTVVNRYLLVEEVEATVVALAKANQKITELISLPNKTWEGRACTAIRVGAPTTGAPARPGIYFLGGVHAREWGSPDILINFMTRLVQAYQQKTGITLGTKQFSISDIQTIVEQRSLYIFPQANPDGRHFSMMADPDWRKNRRPAPPAHAHSECIGVDINRNYDFLWDYKKHFASNAPVQNSTDPCDLQVYIGPAAASEPETQNAVWMLDQYPDLRYFIDLHSYSEDILYNWGDDDDQSTQPEMNFRNPAYDDKRGIANDAAYREYIQSADKVAMVKLATQMQGAIAAVRNRQYSVMQSLNLYPTAGTSDDYAYSRHIVDPALSKVYSYTIEWGSENNSTPFHPPYAEMSQIILEVTAGLLEFCLRAT